LVVLSSTNLDGLHILWYAATLDIEIQNSNDNLQIPLMVFSNRTSIAGYSDLSSNFVHAILTHEQLYHDLYTRNVDAWIGM
jgi:hypothetical protein